jgi:uncharacterized membrane protein YphA (DoxX/SURF4 family)
MIFFSRIYKQLNFSRHLDMLAPLALRLYLAPIFLQAGWNKAISFDNTVSWFGGAEFGLGLPFPTLFASLAIFSELLGGILLIIGLAVRWISIPLMITMLVAAITVHLDNGWLAIADVSSWLANADIQEAGNRLSIIKDILKEYGNYSWLTEKGSVVILNNGIEFSMTYFIMLLSLFFTGAGRVVSMDYWILKYNEK